MNVFITKIEEIIKRRDEIIKNLSFDERVRFEKITSDKRKGEFLAGRALILKHIGADYQVLKTGKIVLKSGYLSLSHSGQFAALAVSDEPVGLDIQDMSKAKNYAKIAARMGFSNCPEPVDFYQKWTAYEADIKYGASDERPYHTFLPYIGYMICLASLRPQNIKLIYT